MSEELSEGKEGVRARLEACALSVDWDLGRGILFGRRCFCRYCSCWGERGSIYWGGDCNNIFGGGKGGGGSGEGNGGDGGGSCDLFFSFISFDVGDAGDADGTGVAGVVGVVGDFGVAGVVGTFGDAGVFVGARVAGDSGAAAAAAAAAAGGALVCFSGGDVGHFPLFRGQLPLPGHLGPALLVVCFGLDQTRALGLRLLADGGGGC